MTPQATAPINVIHTLGYRDVAKAVDWLCAVFGFQRRLIVPGESGEMAHAQLRFGLSIFILSAVEPRAEAPLDALARCDPDPRGGVHVVVDDPDVHCARAWAAGARILREPEDARSGGSSYSCRDLEGKVWTFGTDCPSVRQSPFATEVDP